MLKKLEAKKVVEEVELKGEDQGEGGRGDLCIVDQSIYMTDCGSRIEVVVDALSHNGAREKEEFEESMRLGGPTKLLKEEGIMISTIGGREQS